MAKADLIEQQVEDIVTGLLQGQDEIELVDVEYVKEHDWYLRIYIDRADGIDIEDCQALSEKVEQVLDEQDLISDPYILEVSSPGIDRVLRKPRDFVRERGKAVDVYLYKPLPGTKDKIITGVLQGRDEEKKCVILDEDREIGLDLIAQVRLHIEF